MIRARSTTVLIALLSAVLVACDSTGPQQPDPDHDRPFGEPVRVGGLPHAHSIAAADLDGDGRVDLAVVSSSEDRVALLMGTSSGGFAEAPRLITGPAPKHLVVTDVNSDGRPDVVVVNEGGFGTEAPDDVNVYLQRPTGGFAVTPTQSLDACHGPHAVAAGHLDDDDHVDLVVACWGQEEVAVLAGGADGFAEAVLVDSGGGAPHGVAVVDLDGDGFDDVAVAALGTSRVTVLYSNGDMTFAAPVAYFGGTQQHAIVAADLDGDGRPDLVSANRGSDDVTVLYNAGVAGFVGVRYPLGAGRAPVDVRVADLNGDGYLDVVTANSHGNHPNVNDGELLPTDVSVLYGAAGGAFSQPEHFPLDLTPFSVATADLDGDGLVDLATANWDSGDVAILYNTGAEPGAGAARTLR